MPGSDHCISLRGELERHLNVTAAIVRLLTVSLLGVPVCIWDIRTRRIPDWLTVSAFLAGGAVWMLTSRGAWWEMAMASCIGFAVPLAARVATGGGLGWGDIKLAAGLALFVGWPGILATLGGGAALALAALLAGGTHEYEAGLPFGPFLIGGAVMVMIGETLPGEFLL
jgi:leader peptidase (prepilin peptidase) / N-methyltransferase